MNLTNQSGILFSAFSVFRSMETPTTTRRAAAGRTSFSSGRMMEAQRTFQMVVKQELQMLLLNGTKREEAVKLLLRRIVASTDTPEATAVRNVMRQFQMNYDDAVRALIVKEELGRLKRHGLDSFAAIEELTRKMRSREDETEQVDEHNNKVDAIEHHKEIRRRQEESVPSVDEGEQPRDFLSEEEKNDIAQEGVQDAKNDGTKSCKVMPAAEMGSPTTERDGNETSMSLCQRIGQVSISSEKCPEIGTILECDDGRLESNEETDGGESESVTGRDKTDSKSPRKKRSPSQSKNLTDLTPHSRKRRAVFELQHKTDPNSCSNNVQPIFPSLKKQKKCAEVGDGFLEIVSRKAKPTSTNSSKGKAVTGGAGTSPNGGKSGVSMRSDQNTKSILKRQRVSPTGMADSDEFPIAEDFNVSHVHHRHHAHHHHSKRHKSGSTH
ncbi:hypothetical protein PsorP6_015787 [Peronosclerospora sorghi]|uniref:Uncharacterized protein n=1 Tax=Peronosclerospora sorghi TaxID=230839 RepID=A0ACC0WPL7_9STRA|nr:hypothetical protein PsorP6_015787 [Peronosclerospora sorghi]